MSRWAEPSAALVGLVAAALAGAALLPRALTALAAYLYLECPQCSPYTGAGSRAEDEEWKHGRLRI
jgi:hypothetical protein